MNATIYVARSLDGFIARKDGAVDWLDGYDEDHGFAAFMNTVDVLVMGRHTYETVLSFDVGWPYGDKPVVVLSSRTVAIADEIAATVSSMSGRPESIVAALADQGASHLYVDGGNTAQRFLSAGLITQIIITTVPVLLGSGIPLFGAFDADVRLRHEETKAFADGLVQTRYSVSL